ncbi:MAG: RsmB/NOP family class I SAM-dependent RNA methyltransferase [Alphaproteobacteria bacterium]|nr:RsmB/NOP family class I SAM-dependent RNA methyltransferase [Alphaproteobacteria bacterium]
MTPGGRAAAAIELLERLEAPDAPPADKAAADWARGARYAGSKDRQAVAGMVYGVLRRRGQIDWWLERVNGLRSPGELPDARARLLVWLMLGEGKRLTALEEAFDGARFAPEPLTMREKRIAIELTEQRGFDLGCQPLAARANAPEWLARRFEAVYGADAGRQAAAYLAEAPVDLRVNRLKGDRAAAKAALAAEGIAARETPLSPLGLRLEGRAPLTGTQAFKDGLIEPQDEGSQLAALLTDARPGMRVVDFCAGAGGKTLALAAQMGNSGRIVACDVSDARLKRAAQRLKRAGAFTVERRTLSSERDKWVKRAASAKGGKGSLFDRVLVDAPCTGTGTWRRNPDQKWKTAERDLWRLTELQGQILESAARLVAPGGRLVYVTCSWLSEENEAQIERFLKERPDFFAYPIADVWAETVGAETEGAETVGAAGGGQCPAPDGAEALRLTPADQGVDGFFVAVLGRKLA